MSRIPDPVELMECRIDGLESRYVDAHTCMECGKRVDYTLVCADPMGAGPLICIECLGFDPFAPEFIRSAMTPQSALSLLYAATRQALRHLERGQVGEAQVVLHEAEEAVEAEIAAMCGAVPVCAGPNPINQTNED